MIQKYEEDMEQLHELHLNEAAEEFDDISEEKQRQYAKEMQLQKDWEQKNWTQKHELDQDDASGEDSLPQADQATLSTEDDSGDESDESSSLKIDQLDLSSGEEKQDDAIPELSIPSAIEASALISQNRETARCFAKQKKEAFIQDVIEVSQAYARHIIATVTSVLKNKANKDMCPNISEQLRSFKHKTKSGKFYNWEFAHYGLFVDKSNRTTHGYMSRNNTVYKENGLYMGFEIAQAELAAMSYGLRDMSDPLKSKAVFIHLYIPYVQGSTKYMNKYMLGYNGNSTIWHGFDVLPEGVELADVLMPESKRAPAAPTVSSFMSKPAAKVVPDIVLASQIPVFKIGSDLKTVHHSSKVLTLISKKDGDDDDFVPRLVEESV
jgi:hypothetical protein